MRISTAIFLALFTAGGLPLQPAGAQEADAPVSRPAAPVAPEARLDKLFADLKRERKAGFVSLKGSLGGAYYANIDIEPGHPEAAPAEPPADLPKGTVQSWRVSPAMAEDEAMAKASENRLSEIGWTTLAVESNGIANLARTAVRSDQTQTVLARLTLSAP